MINFNDDLGIMGFFSGQDLSERDPEGCSGGVYVAFKDLVTRFPDSKYARLTRSSA